MAEQQMLAAEPPLKDICHQVFSSFERSMNGRGSEDVQELAERLHDVARLDLPGIDRIWPHTKKRLQTSSQAAYHTELTRAEHVEAIFPADSNQVQAAEVGANIIGTGRFQTLSGITKRGEAIRVYSRLRAEAVEGLQQALATCAAPSTPAIPTKAQARLAVGQVVAGLTSRIADVEIVLKQEHESHTLAGLTTGFLGKVMRWTIGKQTAAGEESGESLVASLNRDLADLLDDPVGFIAAAAAETLIDQAEARGRQQAVHDLPDLIKPFVDRLHRLLLARAKGKAAIGKSVSLAASGSAGQPERLARSSVEMARIACAGQPEDTPMAPAVEGSRDILEVQLDLPWLSADDSTRTLRRYTDAGGRSILCVEGQSNASLKLEARARSKDKQAEGRQAEQWRQVLEKLAGAERLDMRQFSPLHSRHGGATAAYDGVLILADKQLGGGSQKNRTYFTLMRADACIKLATLRSKSITPDEPVAILLGRCNKYTQDSMLPLFRVFRSTAVVRKAVGL